jgi:hypothetical protein
MVWLVVGVASMAGCTCGTRLDVDAGGGGSTDGGGGGSDAAAPGTDAGQIWNVPPPGSMYADIADTEPNDTPDTAEVSGTIGSGYWGTLFSTQTLGGTDVVDYVSFATSGTTADVVNLPIAPCWDALLGVDLIDWWVYEVTPGAPLVEVASSITPDTSCEGGPVDLTGGTDYLLELRTPAASIPAPAATQYFW